MRLPHLTALAAIVLLASCASRQPRGQATPPAAAPAPVPSEKSAILPPPPPPRIFSTANLHPQTAPPDIEAPPPAPTRAEQIARLVRNGRLIDVEKNLLVFSKSPSGPRPSSSMYEDAVILGRLRRQLKQVRGLPENVVATVRVSDSRANLTFADDVPGDCAASAIDAALDTAGIISVQARLLSSVRL